MRRIIALSFFSISLFASDVNNTNELNKLIDIALSNNSNILIKKATIISKKAVIKEKKASYLPSLSLGANTSRHNTKSQGVRADGSSKAYTLSANQLLYDFGKTSNIISALKKSYQAALSDLIISKAKTVLNVKKAYFDILSKYHLIKVAKESIKIDNLQVVQVQAYFDAGIKTKIDLTNAKLQLSNSKLSLVKANYSFKKAQTKLIVILGEKKLISIKPKNEDMLALVKNIKIDKKNLNELINKALNTRVELVLYKLLVEENKEKHRASKANFYPTLNAQASYTNSSSNDISSQDSEQGNIGVFLKWEFFSGFKTQAKSKQAFSSIISAKEKLKQEELIIIEELTSAYYDLKQSIEIVEISRLSINLAKQNLYLAQERYKNGLNDIVELNNAKLDFITSKNDLVHSYYSYKSSIAILEYSTGVKYEN